LRAIQSFHAPWLDTFTAAVSWIGFPPQSTIIDTVIVLAILISGRWFAAICAALGAASIAMWYILEPLVQRPRPSPDVVRVAFDIPYGSFPSGHVLNLTAFLGFVAFLGFIWLRPRSLGWLCVGGCAVFLLCLGYARLYSGQHWPTDVLAGYVLGAAWLGLTIWLYRWGCRRLARKLD
jgi:membrane-associated phospholipid phosphatase